MEQSEPNSKAQHEALTAALKNYNHMIVYFYHHAIIRQTIRQYKVWLNKWIAVNVHCAPKKTCDHIFDDKLKQNYPFTKIFGTFITKSIGHRRVYLVSHLTYFVHLLYLGKLSRPKYHEFSLKLLIFSMLQYQDINCKIVTILFCLLIIQLTVYNRTITRFIADDNVVCQ